MTGRHCHPFCQEQTGPWEALTGLPQHAWGRCLDPGLCQGAARPSQLAGSTCVHAARVCVRVRTGEGQRLCVLMSVGGEEVRQASAQAICTCTKTVALGSPGPGLGLRLALRGAMRPPSPQDRRQRGLGTEPEEERGRREMSGVWAEAAVVARHCHGSGWGRSAKRRPRSATRGQDPAALSGASGPCFWAGRGGSTYLDHGGWVLKAWSHRWRGPAAGESSSASSVPGPRAQRACSTKRHSEEGLKGEGSGRHEPDPRPQQASGGWGRYLRGPPCGAPP